MRIIILLLCFFISLPCVAQGLPPIQNYTPVDYNAENQNWAISQSDEKFIYIGNNAGLLEFNGANWKLYPRPNGTIIRSVKVINDRIYTGCYMEFGYWKKDDYQNLSYHSLSQNLEEPLIEDEQFWNILPFKNWVLFQSLDRIYIYNTINKDFRIIDSKSARAKIFINDDTIYFQKTNEGVYKIENGVAVLVNDNKVFKENTVVGAFPVEDEVVFLTEKGTFYQVSENSIKRWNIPADDELKNINVYSSLQLKDGSFVLGTISNGLYHLNSSGNLIRKINQEQGLQNNTVLSLFEDQDNNIWLGLDNGVSIINNYAPFNEYTDKIGKLGVVYTSLLDGYFFYLGTNQGLFYKRIDQESTFQLIPDTKGQVWFLKKIHGTIFCGHNSGTYVVEGEKASQILDFPGAWDIKEFAHDDNLLLQGNYGGLSVLQKTSEGWTFRNKVEGFNNSSRFIEFIGEHQVFVNHEYKGIFKLELDQTFTKVLTNEEVASKGIGSSLINFNGEVIYATINGVFKYDRSKSDFSKDTLLTKAFFAEEEPIIGVLTMDRVGNKLWGFSEKNIVFVAPGKFSAVPEVTKIPIPNLFRKSMGVSGFESINHLRDEEYLIGITNGYVTLDLDKIQSKEYEVYINDVAIDYFDSKLKSLPLTSKPELGNADNNIRFSYCVPEYDKYLEVYYQYILEGYYDEWSSWSTNSEVSFNNLSHGTYTFKLRARIGNTAASNVASFGFIISRPWYLSNLAIIFYILLSVLITLFVHHRYRNYYRKKHAKQLEEDRKVQQEKKLRAELEIDQIRNEKLQNEIENKSRELAISTMSLIKKNEFLRTIKSQLKNIASDQHVRSVIKSIDRNISNEDDWKFFEEAFNNADKDFLKKVKEAHSGLTPNDLKLCAYLRLNLSSKEIAPLLNISVRSVEVKRYRLRKKISLPHENSLTDYFLSM